MARRAGASATFWAVALPFFVLLIIGVVAWMRRTQHNQPTNPATPGFSSGQSIVVPFRARPA